MTGTLHALGKGRDDVVDSRSDFPTYSSVVKRFRPARAGIPSAVVLPEPFFNVPFYPGQHAGFLGSVWDPWRLTCDPSAADFRLSELALQSDVTADRLTSRRNLLRPMTSSDPPAARRHADLAAEAFDLLAGQRMRQVFDLAREPLAVRDRYGRHKFGQSCLLARRLIEAGVPLVQINWHR